VGINAPQYLEVCMKVYQGVRGFCVDYLLY